MNEPAAEADGAPPAGRTRAIGTAAIILMAGNLAGSLFGFVRLSVMTDVFGANYRTSAFIAASVVPQMFYDLVIGAAVGAALIPSFTEIFERRGEGGLAGIVGPVLGLCWTILAVLVGLLVIFARPVMSILLWSQPPRGPEMTLAVSIAHVLIPTLLFLGTSAVLLAGLYSQRRFTVPAFAPSLYHIGIILGAIMLARPLGIMALPVGALIGAASQALWLALTYLRSRPPLRIRLELTPELRRIIRLYAPVAAGLVVSVAGQTVDTGLKSTLGHSALTTMAVATTLTQFPIGIAVAALTFAVMPSISSDAASGEIERFKDTLALGIRFVLFLTIPAAIGYLALGTPIVTLLFQHHHFTPGNTHQTVQALLGYAPQIPMVGLDQMMIFSFYARKDTLTPMLVGVLGVLVYVTTGIILKARYYVLGLAAANTIQNSTHAIVLLVLMVLAIGPLQRRGITASVARSLGAGLAMGAATAGLAGFLSAALGDATLITRATLVLLPVVAGSAIYVAAAAALRSPELRVAWRVARRT
ncbi:MAG TPA: murein biosynthesis integral membrane protein MurJ [Chloroflexota bacterium]|nr:murein biosynthesis integral membrane protein MurJ [Chloroflexota bacterium]